MKNSLILTKYRLLLALAMLLTGASGPAEAVAAEFLPVVTNFSARQYNGQLQNWHATQLPSGTMCFANGDGVLTFDGHTWQKHKLPVDYIVRSVMSDSDRLYVGSFEEFGYFTHKKNGFTAYTSLSSQLGKGSFNNDEFWGILKIGSKIYFQSFEKTYAFDTATEKLTPLPSTFVNKPQDIKFRPLYLFNHRGTLKAQAIGAGLCRLGNGGWIEETPLDEAGSYIVAIIGDIAVTEAHGLRQISPDGHLLPFPTDADSQLLSYRINRAAAGSTGQLYIGTIGGGVFAFSPDGHLLWHISTTHGGLCNNSVLGLHNDYRGNLWVCLDDGISLIHTGKPFTMLQPEGGSADIGMVYGIGTDTNGNIYVAANQGAYRYDRQSNNKAFSLIPATRGQNWFVRRFDNQLFIGNNDKTIEIMPDGSARKIAGTATDMKKGTIQNQDVIIQSSYYEFHTYTRTGNRWAPHSTLQGFGAPVRQVEIAPDGTVWATHMTRGVIRAHINSTLDRFNDIKTFESLDGDTIPRMCYILKIRGSIYFSDDRHLYQYNESDDRFEISQKIEKDLHWVKQPRSVTRVNDNQFWIATADACHLVEFFRGGYKNLYTIPLDIFPKAANNLISATYTAPGGLTYFNLNGGLGCIDLSSASLSDTDFKPTLEILEVNSQLPSGGKLAIDADTSGQRPSAQHNNIHFTLSYPEFNSQPLRYRFILKGGGHTLDSIAATPAIGYPDLNAGDYTLSCHVLDENSQVLSSLEYQFSVPRPWPLRWWAIIIYVLLAWGSIYMLMKVYTRRRLAEVRHKLADERTRHIAEIHRQQLVIAEQQKQILEKELTEKGKKLASMALDAYSRQQVIDQLRESLNDSRGKGISNAGTVKALSQRLQELSTREGSSQEFWSMFEQNFDLIHEHFFRNLRRQFPTLTSGDLRLCVLIRMNLSTKDIARFQGLTVRGVETARYRLRKKLGLQSDTNIGEFLIDFADSPQ